MSRAAKVLTLVVVQSFNAAIGTLFLPYLARALDYQGYGTYGQVLLISDIARSFFMLGLPTVLYVELARSKEEGSEVFMSNLYLALALGLGGTAAMLGCSGFIGAEFSNPALPPLLRIQAATVLFQVPYASINALLIHSGRVKHAAFNLFATNLLRVVLTVVALEAYHSLTLVFIVLTFVYATQLALGLASIPREYLAHRGVDRKRMRHQFESGFHLGLTNLLALSMVFTDRFMVSSMLSVRDFAVFRNGTVEIPILGTLYTTISSIILPEVSRHYAEGRVEELLRLKRKVITATAALIYPPVVFLIVFSLPLISIYFSDKYAGSAIVFGLMTTILLLRVNDYMDILVSASKGRTYLAIFGAAFVLNVGASYACIRLFGYWGAALSTLAAHVFIVSSLFVASARHLGRSVLDFLEPGNLAAVVALSLAFPLAFRLAGFGADRFAVLAAYGAISCVGCYLVFLRTGILSYAEVSPIARRIPFLGIRLDAWLSRAFSGARA